MELGSLRLIFLLSWPVVVTNKNGSHNTGETVSYLLQINYIYLLYFMIMNWFVLAKTEKKKLLSVIVSFTIWKLENISTELWGKFMRSRWISYKL